jgi:hypothetical protein
MTPVWRLIRKLFGKPKGRHAMGVPFPAPDAAPSLIETAPESTSMPAPEPAPVVAPAPDPSPVPPLADLGPVRLIFSDGTIAPLPAGSPEERRARYLAHRVLEATRRA